MYKYILNLFFILQDLIVTFFFFYFIFDYIKL
jgi:hypothetical protein